MRTRAVLALLLGVGLLIAAVDLLRPLPEVWFAPVASRRVLDREGGVLLEIDVPSRGRERWVELDHVAPALIDAVLAAEDDRFRSHPGVDPIAVGRAALANARAGAVVQGGSTITQQTARLLAGRPRGVAGKAVEAWRALRLEARLDKDEILTWYLNRAYFGHRAYGVAAAASTYFDETPAGLSVAEAATLAALLKAPDRLDPFRDRAAALAARDRVLDRLVATGRLAADTAELARREPLQLRRRTRPRLAPHFAARMLAEHPDAATIPTPIDPLLQRDVEALVRDAVADLDGREVDHAAVVVLDVATGEVLAWVGSADFDAPDGQVDGARAPRSPGSATKPFAYAVAFEQGLVPSDVLPDVPARYATSHGAWTPQNYDGRHHGPVRARVALASSYNLPAVRVVERIGVATMRARLERAGVRTLVERPAHYGLGLVLGDGEVTLEALTAAYAALARGGRWAPPRTRTDVPAPEPVAAFAPIASFLVTDVLADAAARLPAFGRHGPLERPYPAAVKTGTSSGFRDNWAVGYTPKHVVGVWVGNFDGRPMGEVSGVTGAGPLWAAVLDRVTGDAAAGFSRPPGVVRRKACALSGLAPGPACGDVVEDWAPKGSPRRPSCDWHVEIAVDPRTGLAAAGCDGSIPRTFVRWPAEYAAWARDAGLPAAPAAAPGCGGAAGPIDGRVAITYPAPGASFWLDRGEPLEHQHIPLRAAAATGRGLATWRVDGAVVAAVPPDEPALWLPRADGVYRIEVEIDGQAAGPIDVRVGGLGAIAP